MAYVPPHKRLSKAQDEPTPTPAHMHSNFKKSLNPNSSRCGSDSKADKSISYGKKIIYANRSISRWLAIPSLDDVQLPSSLCLAPVCLESMEQKTGEKAFALVYGRSLQEHRGSNTSHSEHTWASVAKIVHAELLSAFQNVKNELVDQNLEEVKPTIVARFGKVLFRRNPSCNQDFVKENSVSESYMKQLRRMFYTNVPTEYIEHIKNASVHELGVHFEEQKELYHVKLADAKRPNSTISCKCRVLTDENKLKLYKIELNQVRHLVVDISCLESNVDLRLALCRKRILTVLRDEDLKIIKDLINLAILDPTVKGGLRWPLEKTNCRGQYSVVGVWHTKTEAYSSSNMRLRLREADRFDFITSTGEVTREVTLKLTGITRSLLEQGSEAIGVLSMVDNALKLIQKNFLAWDGSLVSCSVS